MNVRTSIWWCFPPFQFRVYMRHKFLMNFLTNRCLLTFFHNTQCRHSTIITRMQANMILKTLWVKAWIKSSETLGVLLTHIPHFFQPLSSINIIWVRIPKIVDTTHVVAVGMLIKGVIGSTKIANPQPRGETSKMHYTSIKWTNTSNLPTSKVNWLMKMRIGAKMISKANERPSTSKKLLGKMTWLWTLQDSHV